MTLPAARARRPEDCVRILNDLLDHLASAAPGMRVYYSPEVTVGTTTVSVTHRLGAVPKNTGITMTSDGMVKVERSDSNNVYLKADAADRTCLLKVEA